MQLILFKDINTLYITTMNNYHRYNQLTAN